MHPSMHPSEISSHKEGVIYATLLGWTIDQMVSCVNPPTTQDTPANQCQHRDAQCHQFCRGCGRSFSLLNSGVDSLFSASAITHPLWRSLLLGSCKDVCDRFWRGLEVALRNAKQGGAADGEESNYGVGICENCKTKTEMAIDHYPISFKKILADFLLCEGLTLDDLLYIRCPNENIIKLKDLELKKRWIDYHENIVNYRCLCKSCNSRFGCYNQ